MVGNTGNFQFKYIPERDMNRVVEKVKIDRKSKWGGFVEVTKQFEYRNESDWNQNVKIQMLKKEEIKKTLNFEYKDFKPSEQKSSLKTPEPSPENSENSKKSAMSVHYVDEIEDNNSEDDVSEIKDQINVDLIPEKLSKSPAKEAFRDNQRILSKTRMEEHKIIEYEGEIEAFRDQKHEPALTVEEEQKLFDILRKIYPNVEIRRNSQLPDSDNELNVYEQYEAENEYDLPALPERPKNTRKPQNVRKKRSNSKSRFYESTEASRRREKSPEEEVLVKKVPKVADPYTETLILFEKITNYQKRTCQCLDDLRVFVLREPDVEDEIDLKRRKQRSAEFVNRFARNYLYQIGRIAEEIKYLSNSDLELTNKVYTLYQTIMQAAQAYQKNIDLFMYNLCPEKLQVFVDFIINATKICLDKNVFDKQDLLIQKLLHKCVNLKNQLVDNMNLMQRRPKQVFRSKPTSNESFYNYPGRDSFSMYELQYKKPLRKSPYASHLSSKRSNKKKAPFSQGSQTSQFSRRNSSANSKTSTKTRQSDDISSKNSDPIDIKALTETLQNIAEEKIFEILRPIVDKFSQKTESSSVQSAKSNGSSGNSSKKVTADKDLKRSSDGSSKKSAGYSKVAEKAPVKAQAMESVQKVAKNVQYTTIKTSETNPKEDKTFKGSSESSIKTKSKSPGGSTPVKSNSPDDSSLVKQTTSFMKPMKIPKQINKSAQKLIDVDLRQMHFEALKEFAHMERMTFIRSLTENPFYANEHVSRPWEMLSRLSDNMLKQLVDEVCAEMNLGEITFLEDFLSQEMAF